MTEGDRARAWVRGRLQAVCDTLEPWEFGTVALASRYPEDLAATERGRGLGTALTAAAIGHAGAVRDLWITADADDRPQRLYARLGFEPVAHDIQFLRTER